MDDPTLSPEYAFSLREKFHADQQDLHDLDEVTSTHHVERWMNDDVCAGK